MPTSQSVQLLQHSDYDILILLLALYNSIVFDYLVKLKLNGIDLTQTIIKQIPVPEVEAFEEELAFEGKTKKIKEHIFVRVYTLLSNDNRVEALFSRLTYKPQGMYCGNFDKKKVMSEIDILVSKAYKLDFSILVMIVSKFPNFYLEQEINYLIK